MQPHLHARPAPILNRMVQSDPPIALLHVLYLVEALTHADDDVACFGEGELLCTSQTSRIINA